MLTSIKVAAQPDIECLCDAPVQKTQQIEKQNYRPEKKTINEQKNQMSLTAITAMEDQVSSRIIALYW